MLKIIRPDTAICIQRKSNATNDNGFPVDDWVDIIDEDILCEWQNKYGNEIYTAATVKAVKPARIRLWYLPGIDETCRIVRNEDGAIFEIVNVDDVMNRHQQLEIEIKYYGKG